MVPTFDGCSTFADDTEKRAREIATSLIADGRQDDAGDVLKASAHLVRVLRRSAQATPQSETATA